MLQFSLQLGTSKVDCIRPTITFHVQMLLQGRVRLQLGYGVGARLQAGHVPRRRDRHIAPRNQHLVRCLLLSDLWIFLLLLGPRRFLICLFVCRSKMSSRDSSPGATTVIRNSTNSTKTFSASSTCETDLGLNSLYSLNLNVIYVHSLF